MFSHGEPVIHHPCITGEQDEWRSESLSWGPDVVWTNVAVDGGASSETSPTGPGTAAQAVTAYTLIFAGQMPAIGARDHVTVRGQRFAVDGIQFEPVNPFTGWAPGGVINLKRIEGA